jgi:purine-binding chemotaxis protein CheW
MHDGADYTEFVTFTTAGQLFGVPIGRVQDVFKPSRITRVPLAGAEIAGVLNLRGRIVTMVDLRRRLDLERGESDLPPIAIGIEAKGESFGLLVDAIGEVLNLPNAECGAVRVNLDRKLAAVSAGVCRLDGHLLVVLDIDRVLDLRTEGVAA